MCHDITDSLEDLAAKPRKSTHIHYELYHYYSGGQPAWSPGTAWAPPVDLYETQREVVIEANLAGIETEKVRVEITGQRVHLSGHRHEHRATGLRCYHALEIERGRFSRTVELPILVDPSTAVAEFRDGMLILRIHKREGGFAHGCFAAETTEGLE